MTAPLNNSIVRIRAGNSTVGLGFLVSNKLILTCAHVIAAVLGERAIPKENPKVTVSLDFPLLGSNLVLTAQTVFWLPPALDEGGILPFWNWIKLHRRRSKPLSY